MIVALRSQIFPVDNSTQLEAVNDGLRAVAVDHDTKRLYWSASSIVSGSIGSTIRSVATDIPIDSSPSQEPAFKDFSATSDADPYVMGSEAGCSLADEHRAHIHNWLHGSPVAQLNHNEDIEEITGSDEDSDDDLGSQVVASLFKRGMDCYAGEQFGEAREWLQRGIFQAGPLSVEKQDELNVQSMQFHHALCCIVQSCLREAESSFLLVTRGAGSRKEDARLPCLAHYHLARVQLRLGKLDSAEGHCKKAVKRMKNEKSIGKNHHDYHNSLRLLALIVWANGSEYHAQAYSDQLPESQQIDKDKFDEELASIRGADHIAISDRLANRETVHKQTSSLSPSQSFELLRPISVDSTAKETITATVDVVSTVETRHSSARTDISCVSVDGSSTAMQIIVRKGFLKKGRLNKGIHFAAKDGLLEVLEILLQDPSANVDMPRSSILSADKTPLRTAAARGRYEICKRLLEASATVNLMIDGQTALDSAIENGHTDVCRLMLEHGAKFDPMLDQKMSVLARAVYSDRLMICQLLLDHGADINDSDFKKTKLQRTALMQAAAHNNVRITRWLLDHGANVDGPEPGVSTPLVEAARANAIDVCQILLERNAARFLKSGKGTPIEAASGWLKKYIREWPASRFWKPPEGTSAPTVMRDPLGVERQG